MLIANYYRTAIRQMSRSRFHSLLNIIGLSIGIAFFLLIGAFAWTEWRVNRDLRNADRQCFLESVWRNPSMGPSITTLAQLAPALKANYPSLVANYFRWDGIDCNISVGDRVFREPIAISDSTLFDMFGFKMLFGDPHTALNDPFTMVITADRAQKYFGSTDVVGRDLIVANNAGAKHPFRITGVLEELPRNSVTDLIPSAPSRVFIPEVSQSFFGRSMPWQNIYIPSYVELQPGVTAEQLTEPIKHLIRTNTPQYAPDLTVRPRPLNEYYLAGAKTMVFTLFYIAVFILLMAVINFVNLSIGRSSTRMREIGVRKVLGGLRRQLICQFLGESVLMTILATGLALIAYSACTHLFSGMLGKNLPPIAALPVAIWVFLLLFAVMLGTLAGLYPAFVLSSMPSVDSLKGKLASVRDHTLLRKTLVGVQFGIAIVALAGAVIVSQQVSLFFGNQLGYDKEYVMSARVPRDFSLKGVEHLEDVRSIFAAMPGIKDATVSYEVPNGNYGGSNSMFKEGGDSTHAVTVQQFIADEHYASVYQIPMAAGSFFNADPIYNNADTLRMVINESAARALGWKQPGQAVGQRFRFVGGPQTFTIAGVVKDFHFAGMGAPITPAIFTHLGLANTYRFLSFKLKPGNITAALADLQKQWSRLLPGAPFEYQFMDETLATVYNSELRLQKAANVTTALSLVIVIIGVIGLLSLSIQRRTKEIAIRKVIGAGVPGIIRLFLREYLPTLVVAGLVASPLAWWLLQKWLDGYASRITITAIPFLLALGSLAVLISVVIISQTASAAVANPVKSLKTE